MSYGVFVLWGLCPGGKCPGGKRGGGGGVYMSMFFCSVTVQFGLI